MTEQSTNNRVQLGCGTLIIIAIIVLLFSGGSDSRKLRGELEDLNRRLDRMERKLDELAEKLNRLPSSASTPKAP